MHSCFCIETQAVSGMQEVSYCERESTHSGHRQHVLLYAYATTDAASKNNTASCCALYQASTTANRNILCQRLVDIHYCCTCRVSDALHASTGPCKTRQPSMYLYAAKCNAPQTVFFPAGGSIAGSIAQKYCLSQEQHHIKHLSSSYDGNLRPWGGLVTSTKRQQSLACTCQCCRNRVCIHKTNNSSVATSS